MSGLVLTVTNAGRAALINAANNGTEPVLMASVGVSATSFTPSPATTTLPDEIKRISTIAGEAVANDTIHVTVRDESSAVYTVRSFGLYLSDGTLFAVYSQANPIMEKSAQAMLLLAIDVAFADINATQITFGDTNFINPPATTERQGVVELATDTEATTGTDAARAVTPKGLKAAVTNWLDSRLGSGAPSDFIKGLLTSSSAAGLRISLGLKSAALKDEGAGKGLDADLLDGQHGSYYTDIAARLGYTPANRAGDVFSGTVSTTREFNLIYNGVAGLAGISMSGIAMAAYNSITGTASAEIFKWLGSGGATKMALTEGGVLSVLGNTAWTAGNDGAGSGLDADLWDGEHRPVNFGRATAGGSALDAVIDPMALPVGGSLYSNHANNGHGGATAYVVALAGGDIGQRGFLLSARVNSPDLLMLSRPAGWTRVWTAGNDGAGSGLDADFLDGLQASAFAQLSGAAFTGAISTRGDVSLAYNGTPYLVGLSLSGVAMAAYNSITGTASAEIFKWLGSGGATKMALTEGGVLSVLGNTAWTAGNDGAGSGLDADLWRGRALPSNFASTMFGGSPLDSATDPQTLAIGGSLYSTNANNGHGGAAAYVVCLAGGDIWSRGLLISARVGSADLLIRSFPDAWTRVWTAGNDGSGSGLDADLLDGLQASDFERVTSQNMAAVNGYRVYADGTKECWTRLTIGEHAYYTWPLPVAHTDFVHPSLAVSTAGGITDVQDNTGITSINGTPPVSITFWNADNRTITIWVRTIGR